LTRPARFQRAAITGATRVHRRLDGTMVQL
jgi:hypothetical protein